MFSSSRYFYCKWMMVFAWASRFCFSQGTMMHSSKGLDWDWLSCILFKEICSRIWFERIDIRGKIKLIPDPIFLPYTPPGIWIQSLILCVVNPSSLYQPALQSESFAMQLPSFLSITSDPSDASTTVLCTDGGMAPCSLMVPCSFASRLPVRLSLLNNFQFCHQILLLSIICLWIDPYFRLSLDSRQAHRTVCTQLINSSVSFILCYS